MNIKFIYEYEKICWNCHKVFTTNNIENNKICNDCDSVLTILDKMLIEHNRKVVIP